MRETSFNTYRILELSPLSAVLFPAVISDGRAFSYAELKSRVLSLACFLRKKGISRGTRVGMWLPNAVHSLELYFALSHIGAVTVPVRPYADSGMIADILNRAHVEVLFAHRLWRGVVNEVCPRLLYLNFCLFLGGKGDDCYEDMIRSHPPEGEPEPMEAGDLNMIIFTSGTTGKPKLVEVSCGGLLHNIGNMREPIVSKNEHNSLLCAPLFHICGWSHALSCINNGAQLVLISDFTVDAFLEALEKYKISRTFITPLMLMETLNRPEKLRGTDLRSLEQLAFGFDHTPVEMKLNAVRLLPPRVLVTEVYGLTETYFRVASHDLSTAVSDGASPDARSAMLRRISSVGKASSGVIIAIVDDSGKQLGSNEVGEVWICRDADGSGPSWVRTGDLGYLDADGYLFLTGYNVLSGLPDLGGVSMTVSQLAPFAAPPSSPARRSFRPFSDESVFSELLLSLHTQESTAAILERLFSILPRFASADFYGVQFFDEESRTSRDSASIYSTSIKWTLPMYDDSPVYVSGKALQPRLPQPSGSSSRLWTRFESMMSLIEENAPEHFICMPLISSESRRIGAISLFRYSSVHEFEPREQELIRLLGNNLSVALGNMEKLRYLREHLALSEQAGNAAGAAVAVSTLSGDFLYFSPQMMRVLNSEFLSPDREELLAAVRENILSLTRVRRSANHIGRAAFNDASGEAALMEFHSFYSENRQNVSTLIYRKSRSMNPSRFVYLLSPREMEVFRLLLKGKSNSEIAALLIVSENTVKTHVKRIYQALDVSSRSELLVKAFCPSDEP